MSADRAPQGPAAHAWIAWLRFHPKAIAGAATLTALMPVIAVVATRAGRSYFPVQDTAVIDLRLRDVWSVNIPLVGPYSRFGWNHPGPLMYYVLAPLSLVTGRAAWATLVGGALVQGVAVALTAWLAWSIGRLRLTLLMLAATALAYAATGAWILLQAWNPHIAYPFFLPFVLALWLAATKDNRHFLTATVIGTFLVQTHIGYAPLVAAGLVAAIVVVLWNERHKLHARSAWKRVILWSVIVNGLLWTPVFIDEFVHHPSNLHRIASYFLHGSGATAPMVGLKTALGLIAAEFHVSHLPWLGATSAQNPVSFDALPSSLLWLVIPGVLAVVAAVALRNAHAREETRLAVIVGVLVITGVIAMSRAVRPAEPYLFYWRVPLALLILVATIVSGLQRLGPRFRLLDLGAAALFIAAIAWGSATMTADVVTHPTAVQFIEPFARSMTRQIASKGLPKKPVLVDIAGPPGYGLQGGIFDELDRRGVPVRVDPDGGYQFGYQRTIDPNKASQIWYVSEHGQYSDQLTAEPGATVIAYITPLSSSQETELRALQRAVVQRFVAAGRASDIQYIDSPLFPYVAERVPGITRDEVAQIAALNASVARRHSCRCAVVGFPPGAYPTFGGQPSQ